MSAVTPDLVRRLSREVSDLLTDGGESAGSSAAREAKAAKLLHDRLAALARERITNGLEPLSPEDEDDLVDRVMASMFGLGGLERFTRRDGIENVFANGCDDVFIRYADGREERAEPIAETDEALIELLQSIGARLGRSERRFDAAQPFLSLRLPDGSRLHAVMEVSARPSVTLRRHRHTKVELADLVGTGTLSPRLASLLSAAVRARCNIIVCGGMNAGKTTLLRALINEIPADERLVTIEDALELYLSADLRRHPNVVELETRDDNIEGVGAITMRDLTKEALRMSADRVIVGEVRGAEILDMLQAMSQGNDGSMGTIHARSSEGAFQQIIRYALKAPERLSPEAIVVDIANALDLVVYVQLLPNGRRVVSSLREITGHDGALVSSNEVYTPNGRGDAVPTAAPLQHETVRRLLAQGYEPSLSYEPTMRNAS